MPMHSFDAMLQLQPQCPAPAQAGDPLHYLAHTHAGYWNMVGPFGGATAALLLQAVLQHPKCQGDPLSLTVNFAGPVVQGAMHITATPLRTNRSTQHWLVLMHQRDERSGEELLSTSATVVTALRRPSLNAERVCPSSSAPIPAPENCPRFDTHGAMEWLRRYDWRGICGHLPTQWDDSPHDTLSQLWIRDEPARALDFVALAALCDVFFPRVWLQRARLVAAGTVSFSVYFHAEREQLAAHGTQYVLAQADAQVMRNGFFDQTAQLWDVQGQILATSHQIVYYKE